MVMKLVRESDEIEKLSRRNIFSRVVVGCCGGVFSAHRNVGIQPNSIPTLPIATPSVRTTRAVRIVLMHGTKHHPFF